MTRLLLALPLLVVLAVAPVAAQDAPDGAPAGLASDTTGLAMPELVGGLGSLVRAIGYPETAEEEGVEGRVVVSFVVTERGEVEEAEVTAPVHPALDAAALAAVERARFLPAHRDGHPVRVRLALPITFELQEGTR